MIERYIYTRDVSFVLCYDDKQGWGGSEQKRYDFMWNVSHLTMQSCGELVVHVIRVKVIILLRSPRKIFDFLFIACTRSFEHPCTKGGEESIASFLDATVGCKSRLDSLLSSQLSKTFPRN
jgi:hypothetical protein